VILGLKDFDFKNMFKDLGGGSIEINMPIIPEDFSEIVALLAGHGMGGFAGIPIRKAQISTMCLSEKIWKNVFGDNINTDLPISIGGVDIKCIDLDHTDRIIIEGYKLCQPTSS